MSGFARRAVLLFVALAIAAPLSLFLAPARAHACSCAAFDPASQPDDFAAIFIGTLEQIHEGPATFSRTFVFRVDVTIHGQPAATHTIHAREAFGCELPLQAGLTYAVLATGRAGALELDGCSPVFPFARRGEAGHGDVVYAEMHRLPESAPAVIVTPKPEASTGAAPGEDPAPAALALLTALPVLAGIGVLAAGRRR